MKWLTKKQVEAAAKKGAKAAFKCSIKHWEQVCAASGEEAVGKVRRGGLIGSQTCALCSHYSCDDCPVYNPPGCCPEFNTVYGCLFDYLGNETPENWQAFDKARKAMLKYLKNIYRKEYPKDNTQNG